MIKINLNVISEHGLLAICFLACLEFKVFDLNFDLKIYFQSMIFKFGKSFKSMSY